MTCAVAEIDVAGVCVSISSSGTFVEALLVAFVVGLVAGLFVGGVLSALQSLANAISS